MQLAVPHVGLPERGDDDHGPRVADDAERRAGRAVGEEDVVLHAPTLAPASRAVRGSTREPIGSLAVPNVDVVKIGILGSGMMASAIAPHWIGAGHDVVVGGRTPERAQQLSADLGVEHGTLAEVAAFADVALLAVRSEGLGETLDLAGASRGTLAGTTVIDCGNAVHLGDYSQVRWDGRSLAEEVEFRAVGSKVVKAFNLCHADVWRTPTTYGGAPLRVPFCGSEEARSVARPLIELLGDPLDIGDLSQARHLEAMAIIMIRALASGQTPLRSAFNLLSADG
nr:NAD(P)-binding domain-containing protein [Nocardioides thalensis]